MSEFATRAFRHFLVALDAGRSVSVDWDAALDLAMLIGAELQGLLVEDTDLLGLAALPMASEVGRLSGQSRRLERGSIESVLKRRVERLVSALERAGKQRNVRVSHRTERGKLVQQALAQGEQGDVLFLGMPGAGARATGERMRRSARGPVMLWYDAGPAAAASCELALYLARHTNAGLVVSFPSTLFPSDADLRAHLGAALERAPGPVWLRALADTRVDLLMAAAHTARTARMVLGAGGPLASAEALEYLCNTFAGDLFLVR
jgi:hypothetical protein